MGAAGLNKLEGQKRPEQKDIKELGSDWANFQKVIDSPEVQANYSLLSTKLGEQPGDPEEMVPRVLFLTEVSADFKIAEPAREAEANAKKQNQPFPQAGDETILAMASNSYHAAWNAESINAKYQKDGPSKLVIKGFGKNAERVQKVLNRWPPELLYGMEGIVYQEKPGQDSVMGVVKGHIKTHANSLGMSDGGPRIDVFGDEDAKELERGLELWIAETVNWDEVDFLTMQDRLEWLADILKNFEKPDHMAHEYYDKSPKEEYEGKRPPKAILAIQLERYMQIIVYRYMANKEKFAKEFPEESKLSEKWISRIIERGKNLKAEITTAK